MCQYLKENKLRKIEQTKWICFSPFYVIALYFMKYQVFIGECENILFKVLNKS